MTFFYNTGISAYNLAIRLAAPFNEKAKLLNKGRKEVWEKIRTIQRGNQRLVWFHAASLGEFEQGRPVIADRTGHQDSADFFFSVRL